MLAAIWQDVRQGLRFVIRNLKFSAVVISLLALGLGVNAAVFSVVNSLLFRPSPFKEPERLVVVAGKQPRSEHPSYLPLTDYLAYRERTEVFSDLIAYMNRVVNFSTDAGAERMYVEVVSTNYFPALGIEAAVGRTFVPQGPEALGADPYVVLSHHFWQRQFNSDPAVVGRQVRLNNHPFTVVGVAPADFPGTEWMLRVDAYVPMTMLPQVWPGSESLSPHSDRIWRVMGRLAPGVGIVQAESVLRTAARELEQQMPDSHRGQTVLVMPETAVRPDIAVAGYVPAIALAFIALVVLILLITCTNVANLLLARAIARQRDIALRVALGASRLRVAQQLLTETLLLALIGGGFGYLLAIWATGLLSNMRLPTDAPIRFDLNPDLRVFGFSVLVTAVVGCLTGLFPAIKATKPDIIEVLKEGGRTTGGAARRFFMNALVVSQVAFSLALLVSAGLLVRSLQKAEQADLGFRPDNLLLVSVDLGLQGYEKGRGERFYEQLVQRVGALPGVQSASLAQMYPFSVRGTTSVNVYRADAARREEGIRIFSNTVGEGYFRTVGAPLVRGREFTAEDRAGAPKKAVINETLARRLWPGQEAVGQKLKLTESSGELIEVVGVAKDGKYLSPMESPRSFIYQPLAQNYRSGVTLHVRTSTDPSGVAPAVRGVVRDLDPHLPAFDVVTMATHLRDGLAFMPLRLGATFAGVFGLLSLAMSIIGVYGIISYSVSQRMHEVGLRMAMGARRGDIFRMVIGRALRLVAVGLVLGLAAAFGLSRLLGGLLYGVSGFDPLTYGGAVVVLLGVTLLASCLPARRATRVDPMDVLRHV